MIKPNLFTKMIKAKFIFGATGTSEGIPRLSCLIKAKTTDEVCKVCTSAMIKGNKNRRRNTGAFIQYNLDDEVKVVAIDCGKMWWESSLEILPQHKVPKVDAFIITHSHYDAVGGFDDLRDISHNILHSSLPLFMDNETLSVCKTTFPYLFTDVKPTGGGSVSKLNVNLFEHYKPFEVEGIKITACPVNHGNINCNGFEIGNLLYVSDIKKLDDKIIEKMKNKKYIILDCLKINGVHPSHLSFDDIKENFVPLLEDDSKMINKCEKIYFTGMAHAIDHESFNKEINKVNEKFELAYDGLSLDFEAEKFN